MKFFLDENLDQTLPKHLESIFTSKKREQPHEFVGVKELGTKSILDIPLFPLVAQAGVHVFVTGDISQMKRPHERQACRDAGLHWLGIHPETKARGYHVLAGPAATLIHGLPFVLDRLALATEPQMFLLNKLERNFTKVFQKSGDL
ncbi:PIN-like domain-containing protein [Nocardia takedensis]